MSDPASPFIRIEGLRHLYHQGNQDQVVLGDVSFTMSRGETVALLGRSGSGKTTLLNVISGVDRAVQGQVFIDGTDLAAMDERSRTLFRRRHIGFIYQFFNLVPSLTAAENIALPLELNGMPLGAALDQALGLLESIGMAGKAGQFPNQLSGGEQQRVAIMRALAHQPALILADEPTGNLDNTTGAYVSDMIFDLVKEHGMTLLFVTHNELLAKRCAREQRLLNGRFI